MKYFSKKRFTMRQVVGLLTFVLLGITVIAYAAVTVPNTFTTGPISSSQVNANFTTLGNAMPAVKQELGPIWVSIPTTTTNLDSITVTAPVTGYVIVTATGSVSYTHTTGTSGYICLDMATTNNEVGGCTPMAGSDTAVRAGVPSSVLSLTLLYI